jgi:pimeloyl-ACP methyl ester carboxylesterase
MGVPRFLLDLFRQEPDKLRLVRSLALGSRGGDREVRSPDGTVLSVRCSGRGAAIVCVHGTIDGIGAFALLELELADDHAVWVYDRRGRGGSRDTAPYSLEREVEDLQAVIAAVGEAPHVVGHSLGAYLALRAAVEGTRMRSLVLYEPPLNVEHITEQAVAEVRSAVERGDLAHALRSMASDLAGASSREIDVALAVPPVRKQLFDGIRSTPRELDALRTASWPDDRLPLTGVATLVLRGERSRAPVYPMVEQIPSWVADAEVQVLPGQDHLATTFGPHDLATRILRFVDQH